MTGLPAPPREFWTPIGHFCEMPQPARELFARRQSAWGVDVGGALLAPRGFQRRSVLLSLLPGVAEVWTEVEAAQKRSVREWAARCPLRVDVEHRVAITDRNQAAIKIVSGKPTLARRVRLPRDECPTLAASVEIHVGHLPAIVNRPAAWFAFARMQNGLWNRRRIRCLQVRLDALSW